MPHSAGQRAKKLTSATVTPNAAVATVNENAIAILTSRLIDTRAIAYRAQRNVLGSSGTARGHRLGRKRRG